MQPPFLSSGLPGDSFKNVFLTVPIPFTFSILFLLHIVIKMALKANVTVPLPCSKFLTLLYIQFRVIFKSKHFEMKRTWVWTLVCHLCDLSGHLNLRVLLISDRNNNTYLIELLWGRNEILFVRCWPSAWRTVGAPIGAPYCSDPSRCHFMSFPRGICW